MMLLLFVLLNLGLWAGLGDTPVAMAQCPTAEVADVKVAAKDSLVQAPQEKVEESGESVKGEESGEGVESEESIEGEESEEGIEGEERGRSGGLWKWLIGIVIGAILSYILGLIFPSIWKTVKQYIPCFVRKWRREAIAGIHNDFKVYKDPQSIYIQPYFTFKDEGEKAQRRCLRDYFVNEVFVKDSSKEKLYCLLGDSGTGKTAALVHLYMDYINCHTEKSLPYPVKILSLRNNDVFDEIDKVEKKGNHILLLDALDEYPMPKDPEKKAEFDQKLNNVCRDFRFVVISCRPQFFENEITEKNVVATRVGEEWIPAKRMDLCHFDDEQIRLFLDQVFEPSETDKRIQAEKIVKEHDFLAIRPLVLTYIREIVEKGKSVENELDLYDIVENELDLYDIIVESLIKRDLWKDAPPDDNEAEKIKKWWNIHSDVAKYIYNNGDRSKGELSITAAEVAEIVSMHGEKFDLFLKRSLLTRTGDKFHFTHKSFYEYFMAYRFFMDSDVVDDMRGMDFALKLVNDLYDAYKNKRTVGFADFKDISLDAIAGTYHELGYYLQKINDFQEAEKEYQEALEIRRELAANNPAAYLPDVAVTLNNLAALHYSTNRLEEAEVEYREALEKYRELAKKTPEAYLPYVAMTLNNLATLHSNTNKLEEAEDEYQEALKIRRELAEKNSAAYLPNVAMTLNNLAILHKNTNKLEEAEEEYREALEKYRELAEKNPAAYLPYVATTLNNLALFHSDTNELEEAEREYLEALEIRRELAEKNPAAYLSDVATTLNNLANLYSNTNKLEEAEDEYREALEIRRELAEKNPAAYMPDVAMTLFNMALLYLEKGELDTAETLAQESLEIFNQMADEYSHAAFDKKVEIGEKLLEYIRGQRK